MFLTQKWTVKQSILLNCWVLQTLADQCQKCPSGFLQIFHPVSHQGFPNAVQKWGCLVVFVVLRELVAGCRTASQEVTDDGWPIIYQSTTDKLGYFSRNCTAGVSDIAKTTFDTFSKTYNY